MSKPDGITDDAWEAAKLAIYTDSITDDEIKARGYVNLTTNVSRAIDAAVKAERNKACREIEKICYAGEQLTGWISHPDAVGEVANWRIRQIAAHSFISGDDPKKAIKTYIDALPKARQALAAHSAGEVVGPKDFVAMLDEFASDITHLTLIENAAGSAPSEEKVKAAKDDVAASLARVLSSLTEGKWL